MANGEPETFYVNGLVLRNHRIAVPLDYSGRLPGQIEVFAREVTLSGHHSRDLGYVVYFVGGPGHEAPRPLSIDPLIQHLCERYRLILLDQRGTGLSHAINARRLAQIGDDVERQAQYLSCFRADSIVRDAEALRARLIGEDRWSILGQSYGGFCCFTYLSLAPHALKAVYITAGIPPVADGCTAESVYEKLLPAAMRQMDKFYSAFPADEELIRRVVLYIHGSVLSVAGFQQFGVAVLGKAGGFGHLHYLLERAFDDTEQLSEHFLRHVDELNAFARNPLYAVLHESIYCQPGAASHWAAHSVYKREPKLDAVSRASAAQRVYFLGEMVMPCMFDEVKQLRPFKAVAEALARKTDWDVLYDEAVLRENKVPVAAVLYYNDIFVNLQLALNSVAKTGGVQLWVTSEYTHDGLSIDPGTIVGHLWKMLMNCTNMEA